MSPGRRKGPGEAALQPVSRQPCWIPVSAGAALAWLHSPRQARRRSGVLICPPFGHEYTHTHRTLRTLADALAARGFVTLRVDYPGTGDSVGDEATPDLFRAWGETLDQAV